MVATSSSIGTQNSRVSSLQTWSQAVLLLVIAIAAYFQTWIDIWPYWENKNATYTHGTLVALVAVWLTWRVRSIVNQFEPTPSVRAVPIVLVLSAAWLLAERANLFIVYATLWPPLALAGIWAGMGFQVASRFAFPLGFLYFAIPVWDYLKPALQVLTSTMAGLLAAIFGIPAAFDGPYATLPTGTIFIAEDCSGAHFLCVALAVGVLAGVLRGDTLRTRILILVIAGLLSMAFNWIRILLIVIAYLHPDLKHAMETMGHLTFGWWVFALDLVVFGLVLHFIPTSPGTPEKTGPGDRTRSARWNNVFGLSISTIALMILPAIAWTLPRLGSYPTEIPDAEIRLPASGANLISPDLRWKPRFPGAAWEDRFALMTEGGIAIEVYGNQYREQGQGSELVSRGSFLFDPTVFPARRADIVQLRDSNGRSVPAHREILADSSGTSWLSIYTYIVDDQPVASSRRVQLMTALRSMHSRTTAGIVAAATPCLAECESLDSAVEGAFIRALEDYRNEISD